MPELRLGRIGTLDIPANVRPMLAAVGWHSGRHIDVDARVPQFHPAHGILKEFGGLHIGRCGPGIECATSDLEFGFCEEADREVGSIWSELLMSKLIAVAEVHHRHGWLLVDETGRCFGASQIRDAFYYEGPNFGVGLESLLIGRKARPMLRPDQHQLDLYGKTFYRGDAAIFDHCH
jgi:hypothetical protein